MVSRPLLTVAVVLGFDDVDHFSLSGKLRLGSKVGHTYESVFRQRGDIVKSFTFAIDGVFHDLVDSSVLVVLLRNHVKLGADDVLSLSVNLELRHNGTDDVDFPDRSILADDQFVDNSLLKFDFKGLAGQRQLLVLKLVLWDFVFQTIGELSLNLGIFGLRDSCV